MKLVLFASGDSGVYAIINAVTGRIYVGSSWKLRQRRTAHFTSLRCGRHDNAHLQGGFKKHGEKVFIWSVIEYCHPDLRVEREQFWMDHFRACDRRFGYNIRTRADMQLNADETKARIKEKRKLQTIESRISYTLKSPEGAIFTFKSLRVFCERTGLTYDSVVAVACGTSFSSKGWTLVSKDKINEFTPDAKDLEISDEDRVRWSAIKTSRPPRSEKIKQEMSKRQTGVPLSVDTKLRISLGRIGMKFSKEHKASMSKATLKRAAADPLHGTKFTYTLKSPEGVLFFVLNLRRFCEEAGLPYARVKTIASEQSRVSMGWTLVSKGGRAEAPSFINPVITSEMRAKWSTHLFDHCKKKAARVGGL